MSQAIAHQLVLDLEECYACHIVFYVPRWFQQQKREQGGSFYCPNGHSQHYAKSEIERLREKLDEQIRVATERAQEAQEAWAARAAAEAREARLKKRISIGICPCCKRTFSQLARHMKAKHPDFGAK